LTRIGRAKHSDKTKRRSRTAKKRAMPSSNAQFLLQGGKIASGFFSGSHLSSLWLWSSPPNPDPHFAPFYQRALSGDLGAFVDFYHKRGLDPGAAFYQCIGYLAARGSAEETKEIVQKIISDNLRGGPQRSASAKKDSVREWEKRLLLQAQLAGKWISQQRKREGAEDHPPLSRDRLWQKYVDQNLNPATPGIRQHIESGFDAQAGSQPTYRISVSGHSSPKKPRAPVSAIGGMRARQRAIRNHNTTVALGHGIIPKELFFELAQTTPRSLPPSVAVRRFARKLVS
jgi:hypothetical protein